MSEIRRIRVGLCAMSKKVKSKPMNEILKGIIKAPYVKLITFDENMILNEPIEKWPYCDVLISFYSHNFPLEKSIKYAELRKPYLINDLKLQKYLLNRKSVYEMLEKHGIPVPKYMLVDRNTNLGEVIELDDAIEWNGHVIHKPFVEKPIDAEDHNIYIYFPSTAGGGRQQLFRKIGDRSSKYCPQSSVRREGSFLYETFMPTDGTDVKIYTVGDDYAHAEARKSPALDGKVERDSEGKEVRYPVILTLREKMIAKKVSQAFQQQICGFDLLRANGMSYVCDVNGFSFVKSSPKYYEDCAHILLTLITRRIAPHLSTPRQPLPINTSNLVPTTSGSIMELRCVIGVIRHGDRTPKQKLKMEVKDEQFWQLYHKYSNERSKEIKLKKPKQLQEVLDIVRNILTRAANDSIYSEQIHEQKSKFMQIRNVLEMYGHFSGINRKIQMKKRPPINCLNHTNCNCESQGLLLIIKWGGELTDAGRLQAEKLGKAFRRLYPSGNGNYDDDSGLGLLRLHSTYRHDLKIYASDEGRVQMTAAAFAKGFLALEGELPPILVQMVKSANTNGLLDNDNDCRQYQVMVKKKIFETMSQNRQLEPEDIDKIASTNTASLISALRHIGNPVKMCDTLMNYLINLNLHLNEFSAEERAAIQLYHEESWELLQRRWRKLLKDFRGKDSYDLSKISDIYDNIKYDIQHNPNILIEEEEAKFFVCAKALADVIVPQEYGVTIEEKLVIGQRICTPLLRKILCDARYTDVDECTRLHAGYSKGVASPERFVRTRLYFTSESHLHALLNTVRYAGLANVEEDEQWKRAMEYVNSVTELNYLSQVVIMIFEDPRHAVKSSKDRFHVEIHFSPGAFTGLSKPVAGTGYRPQNMERSQNQAESDISSSTNSKVISRSSSINDKPETITKSASTPQHRQQQDDEKEAAGYMMRDLWSKFSRKKKTSSRSSSSSNSSNTVSAAKRDILFSNSPIPPPTTTDSQNGSTPPLTSSLPVTGTQVSPRSISSLKTQSLDDGDTSNTITSNSTITQLTASVIGTNAGNNPSTNSTSALVAPNNNISPYSNESASSRFTVTSVSKNDSSNSIDYVEKNFESCLYHRINLSPDIFKIKNMDFNRKFSLSREDEDENHEINYLTYPASDWAIINCSARMISTSRPLISTDVIKGAKLYSTGSIPDINSHTNDPALDISDENKEKEEVIIIPNAPCVPEIYSLETLHNALNLYDIENFLLRLVSQKYTTPCESPK